MNPWAIYELLHSAPPSRPVTTIFGKPIATKNALGPTSRPQCHLHRAELLITPLKSP